MPLKTQIPVMPLPPNPATSQGFMKWARQLTYELNRFFAQGRLAHPDDRLIGITKTVEVAAGFTVEPDTLFVELSSTGTVTSNATIAIKAGDTGQLCIIENIGTFAITIKNDALTKLSGAADVILGQYDTLGVRWNGSFWTQIMGSNN